MNRYPLWRYILLVVLIVVGLVYAAPNLYRSDPSLQISPTATGASMTAATQSQVVDALKQQSIRTVGVERDNRDMVIRFNNTTDQIKARDALKATLGKDYIVAVNLLSRTPAWLSALGAQPMKYGLDLQGGIHFLLEVDVNAMLKARQKGDIHGMGLALREKNIRYAGIRNQSSGIAINFRDSNNLQLAQKALASQFPDYTLSSNDNTLTASLSPAMLHKIAQSALQKNIGTVKKRVDELGVAEASVVQQGKNQISVDLPGIQDSARAQDLLGKMASLSFQLVDTNTDLQNAVNGNVPFGSRIYHYKDGRPIVLKTQSILGGDSIVSATSTTDENGKPAVSIRFTGGATLFHRVTGQNIGKPLAVVYDEIQSVSKMVNGKAVTSQQKLQYVITAPTIQSALGSPFQITSLSSSEEAKNLALLLRSGSLSAPMRIVQSQIVGPSLGRANIRKGIFSTELGSLIVILFMAAYYRKFGLIADMALILNIVFIVATLSILGATLTLPGIAAIVLTVGMAVDANVLINERIREELRNGNSPQASIYAGYARAFTTIIDANLTTLIVAIVLFALGSGSVKGFAIALIIGLVTSMITAIFFTRAVVNLVYGRKRKIKHLSIGIRVPSATTEGIA